MKNFRDYILLYLKGLGMGAADAIPGVSGGSIAFITGIYDELLHTIKSIDFKAFQLLAKGDLKAFWNKINGEFLLLVLGGIASGLLINLLLVSHLLSKYPIHVWSFFFGLILISAPYILKSITRKSFALVFFFTIGAVIAYSITILVPAKTPDNLWFIFITGAIAICAMILPGISGAFILLLLGKYQFMSSAIHEFELHIVVTFLLGCVLGITTFSRMLTWVFDKYHNIAIALLSGFMIGSLNKLWPWREILSYTTDKEGNRVAAADRSIMPSQYMEETGNDPEVFQALLMMALGVIIVILIEKTANWLKTNKP